MNKNTEAFLELTCLGIGHNVGFDFPMGVDWQAIQAIASQQGLAAIMIDGIDKLLETHRPPKELLLQWIGEVIQAYEYRYELYRRTIAEMTAFYNGHSIKMMVLKGYACSLDWPKPDHRPCGDIDIWQFGRQKEADAILAKEKGIKVDSSYHHHTVFKWSDFSVENHYDFCHVHHHKSNVKLERIFKELGEDDGHSTEVNGEKVYLPSPNLHALFLMKHSLTDFAAFYVTLRQVLDWGFFVEKHTKEIDWNWLIDVLKEFHMIEFFNCINSICVEDLGFVASIFPYVQFNPMMKEKVLNDILSPEFTRESPKSLIPRLIHKYRRWKGNAWKHEMCYNESMWSAFWSGVKSHLLKPSSI